MLAKEERWRVGPRGSHPSLISLSNSIQTLHTLKIDLLL